MFIGFGQVLFYSSSSSTAKKATRYIHIILIPHHMLSDTMDKRLRGEVLHIRYSSSLARISGLVGLTARWSRKEILKVKTPGGFFSPCLLWNSRRDLSLIWNKGRQLDIVH